MDSYRTKNQLKTLDPEDVLDTDVYRNVWMPLDNVEEDVQHIVKRGPICI
jgi:hypothetical protein